MILSSFIPNIFYVGMIISTSISVLFDKNHFQIPLMNAKGTFFFLYIISKQDYDFFVDFFYTCIHEHTNLMLCEEKYA